jgi:hypothetical protein
MKFDHELRTQESFEGDADDAFARELDADPAALAEYADQLEIHHRLGVALGAESALPDAVLREIRNIGDSGRFAGAVVGRIKDGNRRRFWEIAAAALLLAALGFFLWNRRETPAPAALHGDLLFVVGQIPLDAGDARVKKHLEKNYRLTIRHQKDVRADEAHSLVLISSTVDEKQLKDTFRAVRMPLLCWEPRQYSDLGMIPGSVYHQDWGTAADQVRLRTASGLVAATTRPAPYSWGKVRADAVKIATLEGDETRAVIFRYEAGADMPGLKAPARRSGVFLFDWTPMALSPEGWALFDDEVRWCLSGK